jgi:hypothetical protein
VERVISSNVITKNAKTLAQTIEAEIKEKMNRGRKNSNHYELSYLLSRVGRDSDSLWALLSGDQISVWARFSAPVQTGSGAHPTADTMINGSLSRG